MFKIYTLADTVRVDPMYFDLEVDESILKVLRNKYERRMDSDLGIILCVWNPQKISEGKVIPGDGASYHTAQFDVLTYLPEPNEIVQGEINEIVEFGAFAKIGPLDGLVHLSQITNDFLSFDKKIPAFVGKESKKMLKKGDLVYAKISTVSMKGSIADTKIGLTMRPEGLGKDEWLVAAAKKAVVRKESAGKDEKAASKKKE